MRPDRLYLLDILQATDRIEIHLGGLDRTGFLADVTRQAAVLHELTVIGEAASRLSAALRVVFSADFASTTWRHSAVRCTARRLR